MHRDPGSSKIAFSYNSQLHRLHEAVEGLVSLMVSLSIIVDIVYGEGTTIQMCPLLERCRNLSTRMSKEKTEKDVSFLGL